MSRITAMRKRPRDDVGMPVRQYFLSVGSVLLALFFATDWALPGSRGDGEKPELRFPVIRIHSDVKGPEPVTIDTARLGGALGSAEQTEMAPPLAAVPEASNSQLFSSTQRDPDPALLEKVQEPAGGARIREAFAQAISHPMPARKNGIHHSQHQDYPR